MAERLEWTLRAATAADVEEIARVWHGAWHDGHRGHVPEGIYPHRGLETFRERVPARLSGTTVAAAGERLLGFATVHEDELEQLFVAAEARGTGVAAALLAHAEQTIGAGHALAWLAVVAGNARARQFYARHGWADAGPIDYAAEIPGGSIPVPSRRYEKRLQPERSAPRLTAHDER